MQETFNPAQRAASREADSLLRAAGAPTYSDLRRLLDETMRTLSMIKRHDKLVSPKLLGKIHAAVPSFDEAQRYAPRQSNEEAAR